MENWYLILIYMYNAIHLVHILDVNDKTYL